MSEQMKQCREMLALEDGLTQWEIQFLDDIYRLLEQGRALSPKQASTLQKIWEEH